jgi:hypothetical protein
VTADNEGARLIDATDRYGLASVTSTPLASRSRKSTWNEVGGPHYLPHPPPFDETKLISVGFYVSSNAMHAVSYRFCIKNLTALLD